MSDMTLERAKELSHWKHPSIPGDVVEVCQALTFVLQRLETLERERDNAIATAAYRRQVIEEVEHGPEAAWNRWLSKREHALGNQCGVTLLEELEQSKRNARQGV